MTVPTASPSLYAEQTITYQVYLGLNLPGTTVPVSEDDFNLWLVEEVCPLLDSFSLRDELGFWKGEPEPSRVITYISCDVEDHKLIEAIALSYCHRFHQEAALINQTFSQSTATALARPEPEGGGSIHGLEGEIVATIRTYASVEPQMGASRILHESVFGVVARAAIREVAAWFRRGDAGAGSAWTVAANVLDAVLKQEADRG